MDIDANEEKLSNNDNEPKKKNEVEDIYLTFSSTNWTFFVLDCCPIRTTDAMRCLVISMILVATCRCAVHCNVPFNPLRASP